MGIDQEGPEQEIFREQARTQIKELNRDRAEKIIFASERPNQPFDKLRDYLDSRDSDFLKSLHAKRYGHIVQNILKRTTFSQEMRQQDVEDPEGESARYEQTYNFIERNTLVRPQSGSGASDIVYLEEEVSRLRAMAVLYRNFHWSRPIEPLQRAFKKAIIRQYYERGLEAPDSLTAPMPPEDLKEIRRQSEQAQVYLDNFKRALEMEDIIDEGVEPKMAHRIASIRIQKSKAAMADQKNAYRELLRGVMAEFTNDYPDPNGLLDKLLDAKNGKLPV